MITAANIQLDGSAWTDAAEVGPAATTLVCDAGGHSVELRSAAGVERAWTDPLEALAWMQRSLRELPPSARWIGYLAYDLGRFFESLPEIAADDLKLPLFCFTLHGVETATPPPVSAAAGACAPNGRRVRSTFSRDHYLAAVRRAIEYIGAGDVFQVNLSQRFCATCAERPATVYQRLCSQAPATYGALLDYGEFALLSNSPELFLRVTPDGRVVNRPIKGTRPRGPGMEDELRRSTKDHAELAMIVDLERNDLGRVCEIGSVRVVEPRAIEAHPTVYHGVATIEGQLRPNLTFVDLLRATFPCGSVTGAPKIRAMEIIDELEPVRRGPYCGAIGYLAGDGTMEFNIAIRTMIVRNDLVHIPVGGGIVADSDPAAEYEETLVKARAMFDSLGLAPPHAG